MVLPTQMARSLLTTLPSRHRRGLPNKLALAVRGVGDIRIRSHLSRLFATEEKSKSNDSAADPLPPLRYTGTVTVLEQGDHHMVVAKPPSVICHHSGWAGSRSRSKNKNKAPEEPEIPMLQRVRQALSGRRVNVIHRLDRGCSGCLLFAYAEKGDSDDDGGGSDSDEDELSCRKCTAILSDALALKTTTKTYVAIVRGEGILHGRDFKQEGWFTVSRPIKNDKGVVQNATTAFRFVAGQASIIDGPDGEPIHSDRPRASLVLARPLDGRWHQIRRHLSGLSHPILGDSSHGVSKVNREWKERGMPPERTCLHMARMQMGPTAVCPDGIDVSCPLPKDMMDMLTEHLPEVLRDAEPILEEEGIVLGRSDNSDAKVLPYEFFVPQC